MMPTLLKQNWWESERGWGRKPEGYTLHLSEKDRAAYVEEFERTQNVTPIAPDCYSFPVDAELIDVSQELYEWVKSRDKVYWHGWATRIEVLEERHGTHAKKSA